MIVNELSELLVAPPDGSKKGSRRISNFGLVTTVLAHLLSRLRLIPTYPNSPTEIGFVQVDIQV